MQNETKVKPHVGIMCPECKDVIFSEHRHDFKFCKCEGVFVDGGYDYLRYGGIGIMMKRDGNGNLEVLDGKADKSR